MYQSWNFSEKERPSSEILQVGLEKLKQEWPAVIGERLSLVTSPLSFSGRKARRLLVEADSEVRPPWGGWTHLSSIESERRTFTEFRNKTNETIFPHEVDHVDFLVSE